MGLPMFVLAQKLKNLKIELKLGNKQVFGDVHQKVNEAQDKVERVHEEISLQVFQIVFMIWSY